MKVLSLGKNCWVKSYYNFFDFMVMSLGIKDFILKKTAKNAKHICIYVCIYK